MEEKTVAQEQELASLRNNENTSTSIKQMDEETTAEPEPDFNRDKTLFYLDKVQRKETRDFLKKIDVDNDGKVTESEVVQYVKHETVMTKKAKFFKKTAFWLLLTVFALIISVIVLFVYVLNAKPDTLSKNEAIILLGDVMNEVVSTYNASNISNISSTNFSLTSNEVSDVRKVFNSFDVDSDGSLNIDEFSDYWLYLKQNKNAFGRMDIDGDKILSYREIVAYLTAIHEIPVAGPIFANALSVAVKSMYNYSYNANNTQPIFFEYAADVYFEFLDPDYKGYISHIDYVMLMSGTTFSDEDIDNNNKLSFDEFVSGTFYEEGIRLISNIEVDTAINFNDFAFNISLNVSDVIGVELHKCPNYNRVSSKAAQSVERRRLILAPIVAAKWAFSECIDFKYIFIPYIDERCKTAWNGAKCVLATAQAVWDCACSECESCDAIGNPPSCKCDTIFCTETIGVNQAKCPASTLNGMQDCLNAVCEAYSGKECDSCFGEHGIVYLKDGSTKELRNVLVGEFVFDGGGYTKVIAVERRGILKLKMVTLQMHFSEEKSITLTGDHLLYDKHNRLIAASNFKVGDILYDNYTIENITKTEQWPATPVTMSGKIYVNGIKASCYIGNARVAAISHNMLATHRWFSQNVNEWLAAKVIESTIYEVMWMKDKIVEPYNLYWLFEGGSISMVFIVIFGLLGIYLSKLVLWFVAYVSCEKIVVCFLCVLWSFNYQNKR